MLNIQPGQKKSTFFRKSRAFYAPGGSRCQKFLSGNFNVFVAKKQQKLPKSATNVVFGFRSIFKGLLSEFVEENMGFEGRTPLCLSDTGNKTQKWVFARVDNILYWCMVSLRGHIAYRKSFFCCSRERNEIFQNLFFERKSSRKGPFKEKFSEMGLTLSTDDLRFQGSFWKKKLWEHIWGIK